SHVRNDQLVGLARAGADAGQRERGAHQLQEAAAADRVEPLRCVLRKFAVEERREFGRLSQRFEAAPVLPPTRALEASAKGGDISRAIVHGQPVVLCSMFSNPEPRTGTTTRFIDDTPSSSSCR